MAPKGLGKTHIIKHSFEFKPGKDKLINKRQCPLSLAAWDSIKKIVQEWLDTRVIERSESPWNSPIFLVRAPGRKDRVVIDIREPNECFESNAGALPRMNETFPKLRNAHFISKFNMTSAFHQIELGKKKSRAATAFLVPGMGHFQLCRVPFGYKNGPSLLVSLMNFLFPSDLIEPYVYTYLDDLILVTPTFELHLQLLKEVFNRFREAD